MGSIDLHIVLCLLRLGTAYLTARPGRTISIVTISLGEIVRILLSAEPLLRTGPTVSSIGIETTPSSQGLWFCGSGVDTGPGLDYQRRRMPIGIARNGLSSELVR